MSMLSRISSCIFVLSPTNLTSLVSELRAAGLQPLAKSWWSKELVLDTETDYVLLRLFPRMLHTTLVVSLEFFQPFCGYYFFNTLLLVLQALHVFWAYLILRMVYKFVFLGKVRRVQMTMSTVTSAPQMVLFIDFFRDRWSVMSAAMRRVRWTMRRKRRSLRKKVTSAAGSKERVQSTPNWHRWLTTVS